MIKNRIENYLTGLRSIGQLRILSDGHIKPEFDFSSNDYIGFSRSLLTNFSDWSLSRVGSSASRLLCNGAELHLALEKSLASFFGSEDALLFGSGYLANIGVLSSLVQRGDFVVSDKLVHASLVDGIRLSRAKSYRARHNDLSDFERLLEKANQERNIGQEIFIVVETVYSMDGDIAPIKELCLLANKFDANLILDDCHAIGVFGKNGQGLASEYINENSGKVIILGTLSKALGSYGGFVCCSKLLKNYLINTARSFIYNTALPDFCCLAGIRSLEYLNNNPSLGKRVLELSSYLKDKLENLGFQSNSCSQIVPVILGDSKVSEAVSLDLRSKGFGVRAIRPPTVPVGSSRLRLSVTANHSYEIIDQLLIELSRSIASPRPLS